MEVMEPTFLQLWSQENGFPDELGVISPTGEEGQLTQEAMAMVEKLSASDIFEV